MQTVLSNWLRPVFRTPGGLLYFDLYWHQSTPRQAAHLILGTLSGGGPWRVGDARLRVLGCHNTDPHLQDAFIDWQQYLQSDPDGYPPRPQILEIAGRLGAIPCTEPA